MDLIEDDVRKLFCNFLTPAISIAFPAEVAGVFMKMTPEAEKAPPYIMREFSLSHITQEVCLFCVYFLQSMVRPKMATLISLLRGIALSGIRWAIFTAELVTMLIAVFYTFTFYRSQPHAKT